jgi:hypothetical protein
MRTVYFTQSDYYIMFPEKSKHVLKILTGTICVVDVRGVL